MGGEVFWRVGIHCINRMDSRGIERLYVDGMDELLAKDLAFFHDNFAGSLTKRSLGFATPLRGVVDTFAFSIVGELPAADVRDRGALALLAAARRRAAG